MNWDENLISLNYVLAGLYPLREDSIRIVDAAGLPKSQISFKDRGIDNWYNILDQALKRVKVGNVIAAAIRDFPDDPFLKSAAAGTLTIARGPIIGTDLTWKNNDPASELEKIIGKKSTLLPISFLETGLQRARSVARVRLTGGILGSGFITHDNIFVTNHHVIPSSDEAMSAVIQFNYQQTPQGLDLEPSEFRLDPESGFATSRSEEDDWTLVRLRGDANAEWGALEIEPVTLEKYAWVNIIQHPGGEPKQIALYHNIVVYVDDKRIQYLTDTRPGSSGSPVFDSEWRVVAIHHSGGWIPEPGTTMKFIRNEGISISRVFDGLKQLK